MLNEGAKLFDYNIYVYIIFLTYVCISADTTEVRNKDANDFITNQV